MSVTLATVYLLAMLFLREWLPRLRLAGIGLSVAGCTGERRGPVWRRVRSAAWQRADGAPSCPTVYTRCREVARGEVFGGVTTVAGFAVGLVLLLPFAAGEIYVRGMPRFGIARWLDLLYLDVGTTAATFLLWNYTHRHVEAGAAGLYFNLFPAGLAFAAMFGESAGSWPGTAPRPCGPEVGTEPFGESVRGAVLRGLRDALALNPRAWCCKEG